MTLQSLRRDLLRSAEEKTLGQIGKNMVKIVNICENTLNILITSLDKLIADDLRGTRGSLVLSGAHPYT